MNHIKRKFRFEEQITKEEFEASTNSTNFLVEKENIKKYKPKKGERCFFHTEKDKSVECFPVKMNGKTYYIPEPDPVLIYFDSAQRNYRSILKSTNEVLEAFDFEQEKDFPLDIHKIYIHFELTAVFITSLFTSIEAFMNKIIPEEYIYNDVKSNRTETYNKDQIQRNVAFDIKVKKILPDIFGKDFSKNYPLKFQHITNLKEFRDAIIHTKTRTDGYTPYEYLFKSSFTFKYEDTLHAVRDFINFHLPGLIEDCDCGGDF